MLSSQTIATVQATIPLLESVSTELTQHFYKRMFSHNPELKDIFNLNHQRTGGQPAALFDAVVAYARNLENLKALLPAVERIAQKHTSFLVKPEQYDVVGHHLIETIRELAGEAATPEVLTAWTEAYQLLANVFINREGELYEERRVANGGWEGARPFVVAKKEQESEYITSFYLEPADQQPVLGFSPGQYLGIKVNPQASDYQEIRQYSLSQSANDQYYRISVKRETGDVNGLVSCHLHDAVQEGDTLEVMAPAGDFMLDVDAKTPVVLLSGGVGLTPMLSMLNTLLADNHEAPIHWLHGCENGAQHAFAQHINQQVAEHSNLCAHIWYSNPTAQDKENAQYSGEGFMNLNSVKENILLPGAHYYFCGPLPFMKSVNDTLVSWGVSESQIHYEVFGPHKSL